MGGCAPPALSLARVREHRDPLSPCLSLSITHPRPRQVEDGVVVAQPLRPRPRGGRAITAAGAPTAAAAHGPPRPGLSVQGGRQGRPARLHHRQAALLVGQGQEAAVAVTLGEGRG